MPLVGLALSMGGPARPAQRLSKSWRRRARGWALWAKPGLGWGSLHGLHGVLHGLTPGIFTHGWAIKFDPMGVMHEAIKDGICEGLITNDVIPLFYRKLTCNDGRLAAVTIIHDFHQVAPLAYGHLFRAPVVEYKNIGTHDLAEDPLEAAIAPGSCQFAEEAWHARVKGHFALSARLMTQGAGQPGLANAAGSRDENAAVFGDPGTIVQALKQRTIQPARGTIIDIFHAGAALAQLCRPEPGLETTGVAGSAFAVEHQADPFDRIHLSAALTGQQLCEGFGHTVQLEGAQHIMGGVYKRSKSPFG